MRLLQMEAQFRYEEIIFWCDVMRLVGKPDDVLCKITWVHCYVDLYQSLIKYPVIMTRRMGE